MEAVVIADPDYRSMRIWTLITEDEMTMTGYSPYGLVSLHGHHSEIFGCEYQHPVKPFDQLRGHACVDFFPKFKLFDGTTIATTIRAESIRLCT
jgi:hypothetical protein